jgi:hypothetical protein
MTGRRVIDVVSPVEIVEEMQRLNGLVDEQRREMEHWAVEYAEAENEYRKAKANAYLAATGTVQERQAYVDKVCETERKRAHVAEGMRKQSIEAHRGLLVQLQVLQTVSNLVRSEMDLTRTGGNEPPF